MTSEIERFEKSYTAIAIRLEHAKTTDEIITIRRDILVLVAAARQARKHEAKAAELKRQSERRLGQLMAAQRDAGMMSKGGRPWNNRGNENPSYFDAGIDKNLAKAARRAYPEGWPQASKKNRMTAAELKDAGFSPRTERYHIADGKTATRIKVMNDELRALRNRVKELEAENARLKSDFDALQAGQVFAMSAAALAQRKALVAKAQARQKERRAVETVPDEKTKEAFERQIADLKAQLRTAKNKILAFTTNGRAVLNKDDRRTILACLHPDGVADPNEKAKHETAFKLFTSAVPEPVF